MISGTKDQPIFNIEDPTETLRIKVEVQADGSFLAYTTFFKGVGSTIGEALATLGQEIDDAVEISEEERDD